MLDRRTFIKGTAVTAGTLLSGAILPLAAADKVSKTATKTFQHGVASGDPLSDRVIIWTRISDQTGQITLKWCIAEDVGFSKIAAYGDANTDEASDYTIKIDVQGLKPATTYYYHFICNGEKSAIGTTKTAALKGKKDLKFAVVSCNNYSAGYYTAFARIAEKELDAVVHLGDYIYENTSRSELGEHNSLNDVYEETHFNRTKNWWLHYYRHRYNINRLDLDLQAAHIVHPFITVWDDHEICNNAWKDGAPSHSDGNDGEWEVRKEAAKQAYAEWMPIRGDGSRIYRSFKFGELAELVLLDTRIEGRDKQVKDTTDPNLGSIERTILGKEQKTWLFNRVINSKSVWKIIGSQVIFSEINVGWASFNGLFKDKVKQLETGLLDYWEGYPYERDELLNVISTENISNVVILSASMHCALAFDVARRPTKHSRFIEAPLYNPETKTGSVAVEFATTSITSENFDEKLGKFYANTFQSLINKHIPQPINYNPNPHIKFADLQNHGYLILKLTEERAEGNFYFVEQITKRGSSEKLTASYHTNSGSGFLRKSE